MSNQTNKMTFGRALAVPFRYLIDKGARMKPLGLFFSWVALLLAPYAYVWLCGLVFDMLLKWYDAVVFIFVSMIVFWIIDIIIAILFTVGFAGRKKKKGGK